MTTHSSTLAQRIPWTEEPGGLQSIVLQRVGHNERIRHTKLLLGQRAYSIQISHCYDTGLRKGGTCLRNKLKLKKELGQFESSWEQQRVRKHYTWISVCNRET